MELSRTNFSYPLTSKSLSSVEIDLSGFPDVDSIIRAGYGFHQSISAVLDGIGADLDGVNQVRTPIKTDLSGLPDTDLNPDLNPGLDNSLINRGEFHLGSGIKLDDVINAYNNPNLRESLDPKVLKLVEKIEEKIPMILAIFGSIDLSSNEPFRIGDGTLSQREFVGCIFNTGIDGVIKI